MSAELISTGSAGGTPVSGPAIERAVPAPEVIKPQPMQKVQTKVEPSSAVKEVEKATEEQVARTRNAVNQLNDVMSSFNKGIRFALDDRTDKLYVKVINRDTDEVVRTIPSEDMLEHMARVHEVLGMILDTDA